MCLFARVVAVRSMQSLSAFQRSIDRYYRIMAYLRKCSKLAKLAINDPSHTFCCGGQLLVQLPIRLHYKQNGEVTEVVLPGADSAILQKLLAACSTSKVAGFDSKLDELYLGADVLTTSFQLSTTAILSEVESLMIPDRYIRAELCKLNVYTGETASHYESRANNLCSREMLGTLVIRLPTDFAGGTLIVHHNGQVVEFEWSTARKRDNSNRIYWVAIFNDAEYDIGAVTSGYCLTLTYNIYCTKERLPVTATENQLYQYLEKALHSPHFMREGGILGFTCRSHTYNLSHLNETDRLPFALKGSDYMTFSVARSLGLNVVVRPVVEGKDHWYLLPKFNDDICEGRLYGDMKDDNNHALTLRTFKPTHKRDDHILEFITFLREYAHKPAEERESACSQLNAKHRMEDPVSEFTGGITWCNPMPNWQSALNLVTTPITAELLQQKIPDFNNVIMQQQSEQSWQLRSAGIPNTDIPVVLEALKRLQAISVCQLAGVHNGSNTPGSHSGLYGCYQMPVLLMDIPHWGVPPRITTRSDVNEEAGKRMNSWLDTKDLLYWKK